MVLWPAWQVYAFLGLASAAYLLWVVQMVKGWLRDQEAADRARDRAELSDTYDGQPLPDAEHFEHA